MSSVKLADWARAERRAPTRFCARLYGRSSPKNRAEKALRCAEHDIGPMALSAAGQDDVAMTTSARHEDHLSKRSRAETYG
jgi:hypothetical protein